MELRELKPLLGFLLIFLRKGRLTGLHQVASAEIKVEVSFTLQEVMINHTLFCNQEGNSPSLTLTMTRWKHHRFSYFGITHVQTAASRYLDCILYVLSVSIQESGPATKPKPTKMTR